MSLPEDAKERKEIPIGTGVIDYFPLALAEVAKVSLDGNKQHKLGPPLRWERGVSSDESDAIIRHYVDRYTKDERGMYHAARMVWRGLAFLQKLVEADQVAARLTEMQQAYAAQAAEEQQKPCRSERCM
jgi:hypothetical protein